LWQDEDEDKEGKTEETTEGLAAHFIAHVPVPSQKEVIVIVPMICVLFCHHSATAAAALCCLMLYLRCDVLVIYFSK